MNPVIVIPTYWCGTDYEAPQDIFESYDHMTRINEEGELARCLKSLTTVKGARRIIVPVVSEGLPAGQAVAKVKAIVSQFPDFEILVIGDDEINLIHARLDDLGMGEYKEAVTNVGYGSIRNLGLIVSAILGHTEVVFIDDDEVVDDPEFLIKGLYGLGKVTKRGIPILAKSGYYLDRRGSYSTGRKDPWYNHFFKQNQAFDEWIEKAMRGPRLTPSNSAYGGCMAIHREAYKRVAFDPWITRGEDLDYMINMRMFGLEMWFDNTWQLRHFPPSSLSDAVRFRQNIYRWVYEHRKLEYLKSQIDLIQVRARDLDPYPGPFIDASMRTRLFVTGILRGIARPGGGRGYLGVTIEAGKVAENYAQENCSKYFRFQTVWPHLIEVLTDDAELDFAFTQGRERAHSGYTEMFDAIAPEAIWEKETSEAEDIARRWAKSDISGRTAARRAAMQHHDTPQTKVRKRTDRR